MRGVEAQRVRELESAREGVDFSKCQMDRVVEAYRAGDGVEWESVSPYLADYNSATGQMWGDERMARHDQIGVAIAQILREEFPDARMVSLYDEYNSGMPDSTDARGVPLREGPQLEFSEKTRQAFRESIEQLLKKRGIIRPGDQEGKNHHFISESEKIKDAEELVRQLESAGRIERDGEAIYFVAPDAEKPEYQKIQLRTKNGRWLCEALDASSFLSPENREITHLVALPKSFEKQQDKVWEILKALKIARPDTYHNIFFDDTLDPEAVGEVVREEIKKQARKAAPARIAA